MKKTTINNHLLSSVLINGIKKRLGAKIKKEIISSIKNAAILFPISGFEYIFFLL